ncbi:hypothetical protein [Streptomyces mirabilis]
MNGSADDTEVAIDHLINTVNSFRLTLCQEEYDRLMSGPGEQRNSGWR